MIQQDPGALYSDHLAVLCRRAEQALARGGFDHLVVPSGTLHYQVFDDRDYPYAVNPQFKAWLPLTRVPNSWIVFTPGKRPAVIFHQPFDYWRGTGRPQWLVGGALRHPHHPQARRGAGPAAGRPVALRDPGRAAERTVQLRAEQSSAGGELPGMAPRQQDTV